MRGVRQPSAMERLADPACVGGSMRTLRRSRIAPPNSNVAGAPRSQIRLALVGGGQLVRGATANLLAAQNGLEIVGIFDSIAQFLADDPLEPPSILLLDCDGDGGGETGCRTAASVVSRAYPTVKLALLCYEISAEIVRCAMEYRVGGVLLKSYTAEDVRHAIGYMASGRTIMPAGWQRAAASIQRDPQLLSPRLRQIHTLLAQGLSNEEIAAELGLSPNTVKFHVRALYARLGVHNRVEASLLYAQLTRGGG